jgi:hypothetical protein
MEKNMNNDLKIIREHFGEQMMRLCRTLFSTLLEKEGLLSKILIDNFASNRFLYEDLYINNRIHRFKQYIYSLTEEKKQEISETIETPEQLLSAVNYDLFECKTEDDIQSFKKYFSVGEELCTFNGDRLKTNRVFFAVKKNVNNIKREDFKKPARQDEYGVSVISIQFTRDDHHTLSIKNRYNHTVDNPDATFSNNLDNIIDGLTDSFAKHYKLEQDNVNGFELEGYVRADNGKYYKYNYEINNIYYCLNNIIIDNFNVKRLNKDKYLFLDYFVLDLKEKKIKLCDKNLIDGFAQSLIDISKIEITNNSEGKEIKIDLLNGNESVKITLDRQNRIIGLINNGLIKSGKSFLSENKTLKILSLSSLQEVGHDFLRSNDSLTTLSLPSLQEAGHDFLKSNDSLVTLSLPALQKVQDRFLSENNTLTTLSLPALQEAGNSFLKFNNSLKTLDLPVLKKVQSGFLVQNNSLTALSLPALQKLEEGFLTENNSLKSLSLPALQKVQDDFLAENIRLTNLSLPSLQETGRSFLRANKSLKTLDLSVLKKVGNGFLYSNNSLIKLSLPELRKVENDFLYSNNSLIKLSLPELRKVENNFLYSNNSLITLSLPVLQEAGTSFLSSNNSLKILSLPLLQEAKEYFLSENRSLKFLYAPALTKTTRGFSRFNSLISNSLSYNADGRNR